MTSPYRVIIADDHEIVRDAIEIGLATFAFEAPLQFEVVGHAKNGLEAIALVKSCQPELLFLDLAMPLANGLEIVHDIHRWSPATRIIVFTGVNSAGLLSSVMESGVHAIFSKGSSPELIFEKLPLILQGGHFIDPDLAESIERGARFSTLTERERQTLNMIVSGKSNKEIAQILNISPKTVDKHRTSLMGKLDVHSLAELMARALQEGLIDPI